MNIPEKSLPRIVIVGGGFAGISMAKLLGSLKAQVVLVDGHNYHTFQPLLYQVSTGGLEPDSIAYPIRKILKDLDNFHFRWADVKSVDPTNKMIRTDKGVLSFDYLILATGTRTNFFGNDQIRKHTLPMKSVPQALDIRSLILEHLEEADYETDAARRKALMTICVIVDGPTGVELAGAFAELKRHVFPQDYPHLPVAEMEIHLFEGLDRVLPPMSEYASKKAHEFLEELGVQIHLESFAERYDGNLLRTNKGQEFHTVNCIWTAGVTGSLPEGLPEDAIEGRSGRLLVDRCNRVKGLSDVFAVGDIALMKTPDFPKGHPQVAQPAIQQGKWLGRNFRLLLTGKKMKDFTYRDKGTMATVGRNKAVVDLSRGSFAGFLAWLVWIFVHLMALVGFRNKVIVFFNWLYNYINYDKATRIILRPYRRNSNK